MKRSKKLSNLFCATYESSLKKKQTKGLSDTFLGLLLTLRGVDGLILCSSAILVLVKQWVVGQSRPWAARPVRRAKPSLKSFQKTHM